MTLTQKQNQEIRAKAELACAEHRPLAITYVDVKGNVTRRLVVVRLVDNDRVHGRCLTAQAHRSFLFSSIEECEVAS